MTRLVRGLVLVVAAITADTSIGAQAAGGAAAADSAFRRAQRLVEEGDGVRGRALLDSLVRASREGSAARAEALYWRAMLAPDVPSAQRDYLLITVDHALSARAADALLRLAQIDLTSGKRADARRRLERLVLEHPSTGAATEGWFYLGLARRDDGDLPAGCLALDSARARLAAGDVERRNRIDFEAGRCQGVTRAPPSAPTPPARADTTAVQADTAPAWSVQVAAFNTAREAEALARTLKERGHDARVANIPPFFRVRIGRFATRQEATALATRLRRERMEALVVEAERRGS